MNPLLKTKIESGSRGITDIMDTSKHITDRVG